MNKKIYHIGIATVIVYFISVASFLITKQDLALTLWELMTVVSGPLMLLVVLQIASEEAINPMLKHATTSFMGCTCALTAVAHIVNITVTRPLIRQGMAVPTYFQIGYWPSVEMAVDYVAWGFFMGLAFLCLGFGMKINEKKFLKMMLIICGILCLVGFFGALFINENMWYLAPLAYGPGTIVVCLNKLKK